jgi:hypothetical protein
MACGLIASQAHSASIVLVDKGGVTGSAAENAYRIAAAYYGAMFTNDIEIKFAVSFSPLASGSLGEAGPTPMAYAVSDWKDRVAASRSTSLLDQTLVTPTLTNGAAFFIKDGTGANGLGIDTSTSMFDDDVDGSRSNNNKYLAVSTALVRAIGGDAFYEPDNTEKLDGNIFFNSSFAYDFDSSDGLEAGKIDFLSVVLHEMGHALGFTSGLEYPDFFGGPNGGGQGFGDTIDWDEFAIFTALDMFRYSADPTGVAPGNGPALDLSVGTASYFSLDGGVTAFKDNLFATGASNGDGSSVSHWKWSPGCTPSYGVMDARICGDRTFAVTALDLAAFDAMGYNLSVDALANNGSYFQSTRDIARAFGSAVPEPSTWATMMAGFGLIGGAMRRRRRHDPVVGTI